MLDIMQEVDINVFHDRADITGNNDDDTFKERIYKEGNPDQEGDLHHQKMVNSRFADASKLSWFLEKIGQPSLHWKKIIKKEIKPFIKLEEKFLEYQKSGSLGAGKQNAKNSDQRETKVSNSTIQKN
jgi:hypothetical protein